MKEPLTKSQQELVEQNHNLIYGFANSKKISIEEYYGILAIGLCNAARTFDKNKDKFSTYAYSCMKNELCKYWKHKNILRNIPDNIVLSYNVKMELDHQDGRTYLDDMTDDYSVCDDIVDGVSIESFKSILTEREKEIVSLLVDGMNQIEIAKFVNCTRQNVSRIITDNIAKKWKRYFKK